MASLLLITNVQATDLEGIPTNPIDPSKVLSAWVLEDSDTDSLSFVLAENEEVEFYFYLGKKLSKKETLKELKKQLERFASKKSKSIPILLKSFGLSSDTDMTEDRDNFDPNIKIVSLSGIPWLKLKSASERKITTTLQTSDEIKTTVEIIPCRGVNYMTIIDQRLHAADFSAPGKLIDKYAPLIEETMRNLGIKN